MIWLSPCQTLHRSVLITLTTVTYTSIQGLGLMIKDKATDNAWKG